MSKSATPSTKSERQSMSTNKSANAAKNGSKQKIKSKKTQEKHINENNDELENLAKKNELNETTPLVERNNDLLVETQRESVQEQSENVQLNDEPITVPPTEMTVTSQADATSKEVTSELETHTEHEVKIQQPQVENLTAEEKHVKKTTSNTERKNPPTTPEKKSAKGAAGLTLSIIAIALTVGLAGGVYYHGHSQIKAQQQQISLLEQKIATLSTLENKVNAQQANNVQQQEQSSKQLLAEVNKLIHGVETSQQKHSDVLSVLEKEVTVQANQFHSLQSKMNTLSKTDGNLWLVSQADFQINQAGRKLRNEQDVVTAEVLLRSADETIAEMNDPSLIEIRRAITKDILTLAATAKIDVDGITLKLNNLVSQIDSLPLVPSLLTVNTEKAAEDLTISDSISDWQQNLEKSWKSFMSGFISVKPRTPVTIDTSTRPELTPNQSAYLRENVRLQLLIATQAVPRAQQLIYNQSLNRTIEWLTAYFDTSNTAVKAYISQLNELKSIPILVEIPTQLESQPLMKDIMQTRVKSLLTQRATIASQEG